MEEPQRQHRLLEGTGGESLGLNGTGCPKRGTPNLPGSPTCDTVSQGDDSRPGVNETEANGSTSSPTEKTATSPSGGEQIQGSLRVKHPDQQQARTPDSHQSGEGTENGPKEPCMDATTAQSANHVAPKNQPPAANGSQPMVARTDMSDQPDSDAKDPLWLVVVQVVYVMMWPFMNALGAPICVAGALIVSLISWILALAAAIVRICCCRGGQLPPLPTVGVEEVLSCVMIAVGWVCLWMAS